MPTQSRRRWARGLGLMPGVPTLALASALAACLTGIGGYAYGVHVGTAQEQAAQKARDDARETLRQQAQGRIDTSAQAHQAREYARQTTVRDIYHESEKIIDRPVYGAACIDADGVRLLDRAAATANGQREPDPAGPADQPAAAPADAAGRCPRRERARQPHRALRHRRPDPAQLLLSCKPNCA
jgi:hypothetical protein